LRLDFVNRELIEWLWFVTAVTGCPAFVNFDFMVTLTASTTLTLLASIGQNMYMWGHKLRAHV